LRLQKSRPDSTPWPRLNLWPKTRLRPCCLAQEEVRNREEELEDADAELKRMEQNFHIARLRAAEVRKELALAQQHARQQEGQQQVRGKGHTKGT
jgi:uncharacterized protein (DUF3084 family)